VGKRRQLNGGQKYKKYSQRPQNNNRSTAKTTTQPRKRFRRLRPGQRRHYLIHPNKNADRREILKPNLSYRRVPRKKAISKGKETGHQDDLFSSDRLCFSLWLCRSLNLARSVAGLEAFSAERPVCVICGHFEGVSHFQKARKPIFLNQLVTVRGLVPQRGPGKAIKALFQIPAIKAITRALPITTTNELD